MHGASTSCDEPSESTGLVASGSTAEDVIATKEGQVLEAKPYPIHNLVCHVELPITRKIGITCATVALLLLMIMLAMSLTADHGAAPPAPSAGPSPAPTSAAAQAPPRDSGVLCVEHATATLDGTCVCDPGYIPEHLDDPANDLACRTCGPHGTYTLVGGARMCTCKDTGQVADKYEGVFCDLPPGLAVSGAASRNGTEARINGNVINGIYDRHETTTCNGKPVYEHSGTFGTAGDGVVIYQPSGHDAIWVLAAGENAEEGAPKCAARGALFLLCSASSPAPVSGLSYTWRWVQADEITCANGIYEEAGSIRVVSTSADQEGLLGF